nr:MAG TPA: hypothetical protein [Caudoviricetes sp.]
MTDTVTPNLTIAALRKLDAAADPEPYRFGVASRIVTFPDLQALPVDEAEDYLTDLEVTQRPSQIIDRWLGPEDAAVIKRELTLRELKVLLKNVQEYYQAAAGSAGEEHASTTA